MKNRIDLFAVLLLLYFMTLHADKLNCTVGGFTIRFNNVVAFLLIALLLIRFRFHLLPIHKKMAYPLVGIALSLLLSFIFSPYKQRCFFYLGWYGLTVLCYVLLPYLLVKMWDVKKVFTLYCFSFLCVGFYAALQLLMSFFGLHDPFADQYIKGDIVRPNACCFEPSFYALYMTPFVFMYNYHYLAAFESPFFIFQKKKLWQLCFINILYLISTSTAVFFAYIAFFSLLFLQKLNRKKMAKFILGFCCSAFALALIFPFMVRHFFLKFFFYGFMAHHSFYERFLGLVNGWTIFLRHPLLGVGLGGYPPYLMEAFLTSDPSFTFLKMHELIGEVSNPVKLFDAMSTSTELLASLGIVGAVAFSLLLLALFTFKGGVGHDKYLASSLLISFAVTILVLQFNQGLFRTYIWTHLALTFGYLER
jgi:hypothetical protein